MKIHLIGDSLFARREGAPEPMLSHLLKSKRPGLTVFNSAVSGYNSFDLLRQLPQLIELGPMDVAFVLIGANDLALNKQIPLQVFKENVTLFIKTYQSEQLAAKLVFLTPTPVDEEKQYYRHNALVDNYAQAIKAICSSLNVEVLDAYALFMAHTQEIPLSVLLEGSLDDGLHFGRKGYELLANMIIESLV